MAGIWDALAECICRPPRDEYEESQLFGGRGVFTIGGVECCRCDFEIVNARGQTLKASHYLPLSVQGVGRSAGGAAAQAAGGKATATATAAAGGAAASSPRKSSGGSVGGGGPLPCVVYCHCNSGSRRDAEEAVVHLLPMGVGVLAFDAAGSGLSDGDWVTLGAREAEDLACVVRHLRASGAVSTLAVWGRSMGAVTALLFAARAAEDPALGGGGDDGADAEGGRLCAVVCDSPFARLSDLILEIIKAQRLPVPGVLLKGALALMRGTVRRKAGFDLREASPLDVAPKCRVPCVFGHALADSFIPVSHSERLAAAYGTAAVATVGAGTGVAAAGAGASSTSAAAATTTTKAAAAAAASPFATAAAADGAAAATSTSSTNGGGVYRNLIRFGGDHNHVRPPLFYATVCCFLHVHLRLDEVLVGGNPLKGLAQAAAALQRQQEREQQQRQHQQQQHPSPAIEGGAFSRGNSALLPEDKAPAQSGGSTGRRPAKPPAAVGAVASSPIRRWWSRSASSLRRSSTSAASASAAAPAQAQSPSKQQQQQVPPLSPLPGSIDLGASAAIGEDAAAAAAAEEAMRALAAEDAAANGGAAHACGNAAGGGGRAAPAFGGLQMMPSGAIDRAGGFTTAASAAAAGGAARSSSSPDGRDDNRHPALPGQGLDPHQQLARALHHAVAPTTAMRAGGAEEEEAEFARQLSVAIENSLREARAGGAEREEGDPAAADREVMARVLALSLQEQQQQPQQQEAASREEAR